MSMFEYTKYNLFMVKDNLFMVFLNLSITYLWSKITYLWSKITYLWYGYLLKNKYKKYSYINGSYKYN